jgi:sn-glycerol 3-phosphate transport system substrate-binding protein
MTHRHLRTRTVCALSVLVLLAAACSSSKNGVESGGTATTQALPPCPLDALDSAQQPVEITVWHSLVAKQNDTLNELADEYNASQSRVRVKMENVAATDEELIRRFQEALPTKDLPSIFVANDTMTQQMVDSGVTLPAQSCIDAANYDMSPFEKTVVAYYTINGVMWAASANPGSALVFYNKDHFRRAGLDPDTPPRTLDEIRTDAEAIKAAGVVDKPFVHELASYKTEFWLTGAHAPIVDNDNGRSAPATQAALEGNPDTKELFDWFASMNDDGLMDPLPVAEGQVNQYLAMATGQASIIVETSSASTSVEAFLSGNLQPGEVGIDPGAANLSGLDIGAGAFPGIHEPGRTQMGGPAWYIMSTSPPAVQAASWDFLTFMNSEAAQTKMLTGGSYLPYRTSAGTTPEAQQFFEGSLAGKWLQIANDQVRTIDPSFPGPLIGPYDEVRNTLRDSLTSVVLQGVAPDDAISRAQRDITDSVQRYSEGGF